MGGGWLRGSRGGVAQVGCCALALGLSRTPRPACPPPGWEGGMRGREHPAPSSIASLSISLSIPTPCPGLAWGAPAKVGWLRVAATFPSLVSSPDGDKLVAASSPHPSLHLEVTQHPRESQEDPGHRELPADAAT